MGPENSYCYRVWKMGCKMFTFSLQENSSSCTVWIDISRNRFFVLSLFYKLYIFFFFKEMVLCANSRNATSYQNRCRRNVFHCSQTYVTQEIFSSSFIRISLRHCTSEYHCVIISKYQRVIISYVSEYHCVSVSRHYLSKYNCIIIYVYIRISLRHCSS